jgi:hypothetical protein
LDASICPACLQILQSFLVGLFKICALVTGEGLSLQSQCVKTGRGGYFFKGTHPSARIQSTIKNQESMTSSKEQN